MFKQKTYKGTISDVGGAVQIKLPGLATVGSFNADLTDLLSECVVELLTSNGFQDVYYDSQKHWVYIFGVPILFGVANSTYGTTNCRTPFIYTPFLSTVFFSGQMRSLAFSYSSRPVPFSFLFKSDGSYEITIRVLGGSRAFYLVFGTYLTGKKTTTSAGYPSSFTELGVPRFMDYVGFVKTKDLFRNLEGIFCCNSDSYGVFADRGEDGEPVSAGYYSATQIGFGTGFSNLNLNADQFGSIGKDFCLLKERYLYFEFESYYYLTNYNLPNANGVTHDNQTFLTINNETFYIGMSPLGIVKV